MLHDDKITEIQRFYRALYRAWGPQHWWPAQSRFEVIVGSFLVQNASWTNVEKALKHLRAARVLSLERFRRTRLPKLETLIRSAGYFRQKAKNLKSFVAFVDRQYGGSLVRMFGQPTSKLRQELLGLSGVGPETADSILLYAGNHPVFVVDTYTRRILARHGIVPEAAKYDEIRNLFETALAPLANDRSFVSEPKAPVPATSHTPSRMSVAKRSDLVQIFNEMHGLVVGVGKNYCLKSKALCDLCPLRPFLPPGPPPLDGPKARL